MKSEPGAFSIQDLEKAPKGTTGWDGVRNYQARNYMRLMKRGDQVLFYHSNADPPAVVGVAEVVRQAYPDHTAFDPGDIHYDPKSTPTNPIWDMVDIRLVQIFPATDLAGSTQTGSGVEEDGASPQRLPVVRATRSS